MSDSASVVEHGREASSSPPVRHAHADVAVVGAGPVGLFAAFQCGMLGLSCAVIDALPEAGGQCNALYPEKPIYDIPAYPRLSATALIDQLQMQASPFKPKYLLNCQVNNLARQPEGGWSLSGANLSVDCKAVVLASGAGAIVPNRPSLAGIAGFENRSIFYAVRSAAALAGKRITIAGGGDSALDWTLELAEIASEVRLVHRRKSFRAAPASLQRLSELQAAGRVTLFAPGQLKRLKGSAGVLEFVRVEDADGLAHEVATDVLLLFYGLVNNPGPLLGWGLTLENGAVLVDSATMRTNLDGVFAVGDGATYPGKLKLILTGFAEAALAVHCAHVVCRPGEVLTQEYSTQRGVPLGV